MVQLPPTCLPVPDGGFCDRDNHSPQLAENKPVTTIIHFFLYLSCRTISRAEHGMSSLFYEAKP